MPGGKLSPRGAQLLGRARYQPGEGDAPQLGQPQRSVHVKDGLELARARVRLLDEFRGRSKHDLDTLNELTKLLAPPIWTQGIDLTRDAATFTGEAEQAAPLLKLLDSSPYFRDSSFSIPIVKTAKSEVFHIRAARRPR